MNIKKQLLKLKMKLLLFKINTLIWFIPKYARFIAHFKAHRRLLTSYLF